MGYTPRTTWADMISTDAFMRRVRRSRLSYRELAAVVEAELAKIAREERRHKRDASLVPRTCSHALVGQLVNGDAKTVHELRGVAFERALGVLDGDLFLARSMHDAHHGESA